MFGAPVASGHGERTRCARRFATLRLPRAAKRNVPPNRGQVKPGSSSYCSSSYTRTKGLAQICQSENAGRLKPMRLASPPTPQMAVNAALIARRAP